MLFQINSFMEKIIFILSPLALVLGYIFHDYLDNARFLITIAFAWMTFLTAANCSWRQFANLTRSPMMFISSLFLLHLLIPLVTYGLSIFLYPDDPLTVKGLVLAVSIPVGVTAAIWTNISKGNNAFTLALVVIDTILSPVVLPLVAIILFGITGNLSLKPLILDLLSMVVVPSIIGLLFHPYRWWKIDGPTQSFLNITSKIALFIVIAVNVAIVHDSLAANLKNSLTLLAILILITSLAYLTGFGMGVFLKRPLADIKAMTYSAGMRNIGLGIVFSASYFDPKVSIPIILFILVQQPLASVTHYFLEKWSARKMQETTP